MPRRTPARPKYPLQDVKRLAGDESKVFFCGRKDKGTDLDALGMTKRSACDIIASLQPRDYSGPANLVQNTADVYIVQRPTLPRPLYIKLYIDDNGDLLIVISFHLSKKAE